MRSRLLTLMGAVALTLASLTMSAGPAAADQAHCYNWDTHPDKYSAGGVSYKSGGTYIRRGPYLDCDALGVGYASHNIDVHCMVYNGSTYWLYIRDLSTGVNGWSRLDTVNWDESSVIGACLYS